MAIRLHNTVANSVSSKRSFSAMNRQQTKFRNSLHPDKVEKLTFVAMNDSVLRNEERRKPARTSAEQAEELEEELLAAEQAEHESSSRLEKLLNVDEFLPEEPEEQMGKGKGTQVLGKRPYLEF